MNHADERATTCRPRAIARINGVECAVYVGADGQVWVDFGDGIQTTVAHSADAVAWLEENLPPSEDREALIRGAGPRLENSIGLSSRVTLFQSGSKPR